MFQAPSGELWARLRNSGGAFVNYQFGLMTRYFSAVGKTTDANGDFTLNTGAWTAGVFASSPFPNECLGAALFDLGSPAAFNQAVVYKCTSRAANACGFRAYSNSAVLGNATLDMFGIAWGW